MNGMRKLKIYSIDVVNNEQFAICIHWVDANIEIHEAQVWLIKLPKTEAWNYELVQSKTAGFDCPYLLDSAKCKLMKYEWTFDGLQLKYKEMYYLHCLYDILCIAKF